MKLALFGNVANNFYQIGRSLRETTSHDVHLFLNVGDEPTTRPESDEPSLAEALPDWIHRGAYVTPGALLAPRHSRAVSDLRQFDLLIVSGLGPVFAPFTGAPYCFFVSGGDLTVWPFPLRFLDRYPSLRGRGAALLAGPRQRRGICRATEIWAPSYSPYTTAMNRLGLSEELLSPEYLPVVVDTERFSFDASATASADPNVEALAASDLVVFHPSRLMIEDSGRLRETGQWKQNDLLIRGFAEFAERPRAERPLLALIDRRPSRDIDLARKLIDKLGIEERVRWLQPPRPDGFMRHELVKLYSVADVVADDFGIGWFGGVALEALSIGKPVLQYVDEPVMQSLYPWHPFLSASTVGEVADQLERLCDPDERQSIGARGRAWVEEFHSYSAAGQQYARAIKRVADRGGLGS